MRVEEARCGVAAAPTGCQGVRRHVSSAARVRATGRCWQSEVSADRRGGSQTMVWAGYFLAGGDLEESAGKTH